MSPEFAEELRRVRHRARQLYSMVELDAAIERMAQAISADHRDNNPLLLTVMNGGVVLAGRLLTLLEFPLEIDYLHATRYRGETAGSDLQWRVAPAASLKDRHVIIVDDILDVGTTLLAVIDACKAQGAASVSTAVLVDKIHDRKAAPGLKADYTGVEAEDAYLFGAGMDYRGYWRNAPGVFAVSE